MEMYDEYFRNIDKALENNEIFHHMEKAIDEYSEKLLKARNDSYEYGVQSDYSSDEYFKSRETVKELEANFPYSDGEYEAYRIVFEKKKHNCEYGAALVLDKCFSDKFETKKFVETLSRLGFSEFVLIDQSTALMQMIHWLCESGCTLEGCCIVEKSSFLGFKFDLINGLLFKIHK